MMAVMLYSVDTSAKIDFSIDWVVDKGNILNDNGDLAVLLTETNGGTRLSSTRYVHYGTITAKRELKPILQPT